MKNLIEKLRSISLRRKSFIGFGFILLLILSSIVISINNLSKLNKSAAIVYDRVLMSTSILKDILNKYEKFDKSTILYLIDTNPELLKDVTFYKESIIEDLDIVRDRVLNEEVIPLIKKISEHLNNIDVASFNLKNWQEEEAKNQIFDLITEMSDAETAYGFKIVEEAKANYIEIKNGFIVFSVFMIILFLIMIFMFNNNILRPIRSLSRFCKKATENLNLRAFEPVEPELKVLANSLNLLLENIAKNGEEIASQKAKVEQLVHVLCHDIKNPIGAIVSYIELAEEGITDLNDKKAKLKGFANNAIEIIDDVRGLLAVQSGKLTLELGPVSLLETVNQSLGILENRIKDKGLNIELLNLENMVVLAEKNSLVNSVINNLLTNAVKFSFDNDKITLSTEESGENIYLKIRDYGIGMPKELINDVFDETKPTSRKGTSGEKGTGFGMPLVKKFMNGYEGDIEIISLEKEDSPNNHGTTMILKFWRYSEEKKSASL